MFSTTSSLSIEMKFSLALLQTEAERKSLGNFFGKLPNGYDLIPQNLQLMTKMEIKSCEARINLLYICDSREVFIVFFKG